MGPIRKIVCAKVLGLVLVGSARADQWTFFHPEEVTGLSYKVVLVDVSGVGETRGHDQYVCEVHARRNSTLGDFNFTAGYFPPTVKGRHAAEKACSKWMDEAGKRVRAAH